MEKVCPRCKLPFEGIGECEYCGLVLAQYTKETKIKKKPEWQDNAEKKSSRQYVIMAVIVVIGFIGYLYFWYIPQQVAKKSAEIERLKSEAVKKQKKEQRAKRQRQQQAKAKRERKKAAIKIKSPEEIREDKIKNQFSAWDGSHRNLERLIKKAMNDPDSYDHAETVYWDKGDHLIVKTTFRGKNAFGGVVKNWVQAKVDLDGNVIQVLAKGP